MTKWSGWDIWDELPWRRLKSASSALRRSGNAKLADFLRDEVAPEIEGIHVMAHDAVNAFRGAVLTPELRAALFRVVQAADGEDGVAARLAWHRLVLFLGSRGDLPSARQVRDRRDREVRARAR